MFSEPKVNVIDSDEGFSIETHGINSLEYREGDTSVFIFVEMAHKDGKFFVEVARDTIRHWSSSRGSRPVTEKERLTIIERIRAALKWKDTEIEVS